MHVRAWPRTDVPTRVPYGQGDIGQGRVYGMVACMVSYLSGKSRGRHPGTSNTDYCRRGCLFALQSSIKRLSVPHAPPPPPTHTHPVAVGEFLGRGGGPVSDVPTLCGSVIPRHIAWSDGLLTKGPRLHYAWRSPRQLRPLHDALPESATLWDAVNNDWVCPFPEVYPVFGVKQL